MTFVVAGSAWDGINVAVPCSGCCAQLFAQLSRPCPMQVPDKQRLKCLPYAGIW